MSDRTPNQNEHACDEHFELVRRQGSFSIHGTEVPVEEEFYRCVVCGEEELTFEQAQALELQASRAYREQNGFLQPAQIRSMREQWGLTQAELEDALGLGRKTVARWEAGRVLQQRALDNLLRAIDRFPQVLLFVADLQRSSVRPAREWLASAAAAPELRLPRSLRESLETAAASEGTDANAYAIMILAQGVERRTTNREIGRLHRRFDELNENFSHWTGSTSVADEPWLRSHKLMQANNAEKAIAI